MSSATEVRLSYLDSLESLRDASSPVIANLTELAYEAADSHPTVIAKVIEERFRMVPPSQKLPFLYLVDSIVKKTEFPYRDLFSSSLVSLFAHAFQAVGQNLKNNEEVNNATKVRGKLYKVRQTWSEIFRPDVLLALDKAVQKHDPRWPITPAKGPMAKVVKPLPAVKANIHINPNFNKASPSGPQMEAIQDQLERTKRELLLLQQKKAEMDLENLQKELEAGNAAVAAAAAALNSNDYEPSPSFAPSFSPEPSPPPVAPPTPKPKQTEPKSSSSHAKSSSSVKGNAKKSSSDTTSRSSSRKESSSRRDPRMRGKNTPDRRPPAVVPTAAAASSEAPPPPTIRNDKPPSSSASKRSASQPKEDADRKRAKKSGSPPHRRVRSPLLSETLLRKSKERSPVGGGGNKSPPRRERQTKSRSPTKKSPPRMKQSENPPLIPPKVPEQDKKSFRIPKKAPGAKRSPSPGGGDGFQEEGPHVEFGKSKDQQQRNKRQQQNKRNKLNAELFDEPSTGGANSNKQGGGRKMGWAQVKVDKPDEFRTPQRGNRNNQQRFGGRPQNNLQPRIAPFGGGPFGGAPQPDFEGFRNADPHIVESQVIPQIIKTAQESLAAGTMSTEQFSDLMRQVLILKEQAMVKRADMHQHQQGGGPPGPFMPPQQQGMPPPGMPPFGMPFNMPPPNMMGGGPINLSQDLPMADPQMLEEMSHDPYKSIEIDNHMRDIRFYAEIAVCAMSDDSVRELSFQPMGTRRAFLDGNPTVIPPLLLDSHNYTDFMVGGITHKIKIGAPTRELWVDGRWYECYFEKEIRLSLGNMFHTLFLEGPAPTVKIGEIRPDLCAGYVNIIVNASFDTKQRLYLDSKPQLLEIDGKAHILQLCDGFNTLLINGQPFQTNFGGIPLLIFVNGNKFFLRLTSLPHGIIPGQVRIWGMDGNMEMRPSAALTASLSRSGSPSSTTDNPLAQTSPATGSGANRFDSETHTGAFDKLMSLLPPSNMPTPKRDPDACSESSYKCDDSVHEEPTQNSNNPAVISTSTPQTPSGSGSGAPGTPGTPVNMNNLWEQLVSAGLITGSTGGDNARTSTSAGGAIPGLDSQPSVDKSVEDNKENVKAGMAENKDYAAKEAAKVKEEVSVKAQSKIIPVLLKKPDTLKPRQDAIVNMVYDSSAFQCKNCGLRFTSSKMNTAGAYVKHLDWHYRMNRREKERKMKGKTQSRGWYLKQHDWIVSEEFDDEDKDEYDREQSCSPDGGEEIKSVLVEDGEEKEACPICGEDFAQDYVEATDTTAADADAQLHYINAVRAPEDGRIYHPQCHQDLKKQGTRSALMEDISMEEEEEEEATSALKEEVEEMEEGDAVKKEEVEDAATVKEEPMETSETSEVKKEEGEDNSEEVKAESAGADEAAKSPKAEGEDEAAAAATSEGTAEIKTKVTEGEELEDKVKVEFKSDELNLSTMDDPKVESQMAPPSFTKLNINITSNIERVALERRESVMSSQSDSSEVDSEFDPDGIKQNRPEDEAEAQRDEEKPRMRGRNFQEMPPTKKSSELSGLCSIM